MSQHFSRRFRVNAPLSKVSAFHHDSRALRDLTPPPVFVQFHNVEPLGEGSLADFTLWLGPLPVRWAARHTEVDPRRGFTDTQERGPFKSWVHRHSFEVVDDRQTDVIDTIEAQPGDHPLWGLVSRLMWLNLPVLFAYRAWKTRRACEAS
jgi:ligand-binding SRPBCC domain-containing protein